MLGGRDDNTPGEPIGDVAGQAREPLSVRAGQRLFLHAPGFNLDYLPRVIIGQVIGLYQFMSPPRSAHRGSQGSLSAGRGIDRLARSATPRLVHDA